jgi:hypothetical protein
MTNNAIEQPEKRKLSKVELFVIIGIILFLVCIILSIFLHFARIAIVLHKEKKIDETILEIEEVDGSFAEDEDDEFQDIKDDFQKYWDSSPIYLCDLAWNANEYIKNNWEKRIDRWKEARQESKYAAFLLAECCWLKFNLDNFSEAKILYFLAVTKGLPEARIRLSEILLWGFNTPQNELSAEEIVQPLTTTKYGSMIHTIFVEQPIVSEKCAKIYKYFFENYDYEGMTQKEIENAILTCRHNLCDEIEESLLQGIEKPKKIDKLKNGRTVCTWQVIKYPFNKGFEIHFNKNGKADDIYTLLPLPIEF